MLGRLRLTIAQSSG